MRRAPDKPERTIGAILGSSFSEGFAEEMDLAPEAVSTPHGSVTLHRTEAGAYCLFRHGLPHRLLPHHINWRAQAAALKQVGVGALLVASSVGVLDPTVPLYTPLLVSDLIMLENRLPDGTLCTMFEAPSDDHAHLVLHEGLFSRDLAGQLRQLAEAAGFAMGGEAVFGYAPGPRTKTRAENAAWARLGAQVNSMSLGPEVVLANELGIPYAGLVVGHKYSLPTPGNITEAEVATSLRDARTALERIVRLFLTRGQAVSFGNSLFRFGSGT